MSKSQATEAFINLLHEVELLQADDALKRTVRKLIRVVAFQHEVTGLEKVDQIALARKLLDCSIETAIVRDRLISAYGISRATAYRIILESMELSQKVPDFETRKASN